MGRFWTVNRFINFMVFILSLAGIGFTLGYSGEFDENSSLYIGFMFHR